MSGRTYVHSPLNCVANHSQLELHNFSPCAFSLSLLTLIIDLHPLSFTDCFYLKKSSWDSLASCF